MNYILTYNYCAIFNLLVILITFYSKKYIPNQQNRLYISLIWVTFIGTIFDILDSAGSNNPQLFNLGYLNLTSYGYFIFHNLTPFIFCLYTLSLGGMYFKDFALRKKIMAVLPFIVSLFIIISTPITKAVFYYDKDYCYHRGDYLFILYFVAFYYLVYCIIYTAVCKDVLPVQVKKALYSFISLSLASVIFQMIHSRHLIENFAISICITIMFLAIQKPEELIDASTGVLNRNSFTSILRLVFKHKERMNICILHLEDIGKLTKAFGVEHTDKTVKEIAQYFEEKNKNRVFYLHSHTFVILFSKKDLKPVDAMVNRLLKRFKETWDCGGVKMTLSFRACTVRIPADAASVDSVFEYIDQFTTKKKWENAVIYGKNMNLRDKTRESAVERALLRAIETDGFEVLYQPIYSNEKGGFISAEALVRLNDERLGMIPPDEFIPVAERSGSILAIGRFVFEKVCRVLHENDLEQYGIEYIQVNLSVIQCMQENLANELIAIMEYYEVKPHKIRLEITETAAANSPRMLHENMNRLYEAGIRFALDDFGTGYSNINFLADLPLETIKLDKSMVWAASENKKAEIILESSVAMIKKMKMQIVAEGIETSEQMENLKEMGCDCLQGYYFSKPVEYDRLLELLSSFNN